MAVPDTETFSLEDVYNEVSPASFDQNACFAAADSDGFDSDYSYYEANSLMRFRNYDTPDGGSSFSVTPTSFSFDGDGGSGSFSVSFQSRFYYVTVANNASSWVTMSTSSIYTSPASRSFTVAVWRPTPPDNRTATITFTLKKKSDDSTVTTLTRYIYQVVEETPD